MAPTTVVLSRRELEQLLGFDALRKGVEEGFVAVATSTARLFPLVRETLPNDSMFGLRSCFWPERGLLGLKVSGFYAANRTLGRDSHQAAVLLVDPADGHLRAVLDGNHITWARTAVAGAVGSFTLAREDAKRLLIVGNGLQAEAQARSHAWIFSGRDLRVSVYAPRDSDGTKVAEFVRRLGSHGVDASPASDLGVAAASADIIVTATPSRSPLLRKEWVRPGTHITALGSDAPGKMELEPDLVQSSVLVADDVDQARRVGEAQNLPSDALAAPLGAILAGSMAGRSNRTEITVFDSTGLAIHDVIAASIALASAEARSLGSRITLD